MSVGLSVTDWEESEGKLCPRCNGLDLRLIEGLCRNCYALGKKKEAKQMERKAREKALRSIFRERRLLAKKS